MSTRNTRLAIFDKRISNFVESFSISSRQYFIKCGEVKYGDNSFQGSVTMHILGQNADTQLPQDASELLSHEIEICDRYAIMYGSRTKLGIYGWVHNKTNDKSGIPASWSKTFSFKG